MKKKDVFVALSKDYKALQWLSSSLEMCFPKVNVVPLIDINDVNLNLLKSLQLIVCTEAFYDDVVDFFTDKGLRYPTLLVSTKKKVAQVKLDEADFALDCVPADLLSPSILKLTVNSLLRDFQKDQKLRELAHFDELTKAANRRLFSDRLKQALENAKRYHQPISLAYFDLDKFKPINDTYGHHVGDLLLIEFVKSVKSCLRNTDTLGRLGGDEFALLMLLTEINGAVEIIDRVMDKLAKPVELDNYSIQILTSTGIVGTPGQLFNDTIDRIALMKQADEAVYAAKKEGLHGYVCSEIEQITT